VSARPAGTRWWHGSFTLPIDGAGRWQVGPFELWACRGRDEWRLASRSGEDSLESTLRIEVPCRSAGLPEGLEPVRYALRSAPERLVLQPALADRPVVVSPESPLMVPPQQAITIYVSTPLWMEVLVGSTPASLVELPMHRPSDTWFGPSTMQGELCYAVRTGARLSLAEVPIRPHRAVSVVEISNRSQSTLPVEKVKLPAPQMSIWAAADGHLWTEAVSLEQQAANGGLATVRLGKGPPREAEGTSLVRSARERSNGGLLTRAFSGLLG